jgi:hypothetical protein
MSTRQHRGVKLEGGVESKSYSLKGDTPVTLDGGKGTQKDTLKLEQLQ